MKKFVKKVLFFSLFFLLFFIFLNSVFLGILVLTDWDFRKRIESLNFVNPDFELLVLGSSLPEYGIDTELLSAELIKSYNLSLIGNPVRSSFIQLNEYLTKYSKKPKYVLLGFNSSLEGFDSDLNQPIVEFTMKPHNFDIHDIPIIKFRWFGVDFLKKVLSNGHRKTRISFGQIKSLRVKSDKSNYNELNLDLEKYDSSYWFGEIARLCSQNGIKLIIIEMPGERGIQNQTEIGPYTLNFGNGHSAILYNFNNQEFCSIFNVNEDWVGISHFNEIGARKFTKELLKIFE